MNKRDGAFNSIQLHRYMNAGVPLSNNRHKNRREETSAERKNLVLPKLLPDAFSLSSYGRKFTNRAESLERRRGNNHRSINKFNGSDPFLEKLERYKPERSRKFQGFRAVNKRSTFMAVKEVDEEGMTQNRKEMSELIDKTFSRLNLQDMLTIVPLKNSGLSGNTRKALHVPSLRMFVVKEVPIIIGQGTKQDEYKLGFEQKVLEKNCDAWQKNSSQTSDLLNLQDVVWNAPQGYASLILEHCPGGSLKALLQSVEILPENPVKFIAKELLRCLKTFHNKFFCNYGGISLGQILFDHNFHIKLGMGLSRRLKQGKKIQGGSKYIGKVKKMKKKFRRDTFEIGIVLLRCILGTLFDETFHLLVEYMNEELFTPNLSKTLNNSKDDCFDVFRILEIVRGNAPFRAGEALAEHYDSLVSFMIGESRPHNKKPILLVILNGKPEVNRKLIFLQKMCKARYTMYSKKFLRMMKRLTQLDPDDRSTPEEALNSDYFRPSGGGQNKMSSTFLRSTLRKTLQNSKHEGFYNRRRKAVVGGLDLDELVAIDPDLSKKANDESSGLEESNLYLEKIMKTLELMYRRGIRWYELDYFPNPASSQDLENLFSTLRRGRPFSIHPDSPQIRDLSQELGCSEQRLFDRLKALLSVKEAQIEESNDSYQ